MKRKEMFNIIRSCIKHNHFDEANQYSQGEISWGRLAEICTETILSRIEKEGMLPPKTVIALVEEHEGFGGTSEMEVNAWDPEEDK